jgi:multidrug efflux pump subunit AcrB
LDGVDEVEAKASEGSGSVTAELLEGVDQQKVYQDIKQEIDRITTFPDDAEEPQVTLDSRKRGVLQLELSGDVDEGAIREAAEHVRDRLLQHESISQIELLGVRDYEITIEVSQEALRAHKLTLADIAAKVRNSAVELPGGKIETDAGEVMLRVDERRDWASEFRRIPIVTDTSGAFVYLEQLGTVHDGFEDADVLGTFNGQRAIGVAVYRIGDQTPLGVADAVREAMLVIESELPPGVTWNIRRDMSDIYGQRLRLLGKNAAIGLALVLAILGLFLEFKLAFWVMMGIPISFMGGLLLLPGMDVTINMISMFAFIVALGIVVDDAIVAGENIYEYRQRGMNFIDAAIRGARDVAVPITFAILTNVIAFMPLLFVPGFIGKIWRNIPLVVCTVFVISLVEALFILPSHLAHTNSKPGNRLSRFLHGRQQAFSDGFRHLVSQWFSPFLRICLNHRTLTLCLGGSLLVLTYGYVASGRIGFIPMPRVESDRAVASVYLPYGSPMSRVAEARDLLAAAGQRVVDAHGGDRMAEGVFAMVNDNKAEVTFYLTDPLVRPLSTAAFTRKWRAETGSITGAESMQFESNRGGPGSGKALTIELSHRDIATLDRAGTALAAKLAEFGVTKDIDDGYTPGKRQFNFTIKPDGQSIGLTAMDVARQVRNAFQGNEAFKQQRGRNEVTVRVRRPEQQRVSIYDVEQLIIQTPNGAEAPLMDVANVEPGRAYTSIDRRNGRRTIAVSADVEPIGETSRVTASLNDEILPELAMAFPGLTYQFEGRQAEMADAVAALGKGVLIAVISIFILLAIPFGSYVQPVVVMMAIPFGAVGAVLGHLIMGYNLSIISMMGMVALAGVVVNDSLVLIDYTNRVRRERGLSPIDAVCLAATRRFRPILLTTLTTFGGLAPMIFETSRQARFMVPMALSLGFGILFATVITLIIVPALYVLCEDIRPLVGDATIPSSAQPQPA